ncbi:MAG: FMN-binding protein [Spirochaetales bacterium]|nr:FMN-binding protein [Spirochaetales bacterium]
MLKYIVKTAVVLAAICAVAAVVLAGLNEVTDPKIQEYEAQKVISALEEVSCGMQIGEKKDVNQSYVAYMYPLSSGGKDQGYILGLTSTGYGGELTLVASYDLNGVVMAAKLVADEETPGVGKKAENEGYMDKFVGTGTSTAPVPTSKSMLSDADSAAVSGASITFTGISKALAYGSDFVKSL